MVKLWADAGFLCPCVDLQHQPGEHREGNIIRVGADVRGMASTLRTGNDHVRLSALHLRGGGWRKVVRLTYPGSWTTPPPRCVTVRPRVNFCTHYYGQANERPDYHIY